MKYKGESVMEEWCSASLHLFTFFFFFLYFFLFLETKSYSKVLIDIWYDGFCLPLYQVQNCLSYFRTEKFVNLYIVEDVAR